MEVRTRGLAHANEELIREVAMRRRVETDLGESEQEYRTLFVNSKDAIVISDRAGNILNINPAALNMFGYSEEDIMCHNIVDLYVDPEGRKALVGKIEQGGFIKDYEVRLKRSDQTVMDCVVTATARLDAADNIVGYQSIVRNISNKKKADAERERLIVDLQGALHQVKTLTGLFPICANCHKIRDDKGYWNKLESYIETHSEAEFSHGICPDCEQELYEDLPAEQG